MARASTSVRVGILAVAALSSVSTARGADAASSRPPGTVAAFQRLSAAPKLTLEVRQVYATPEHLTRVPWSSEPEGRIGFCFFREYSCREVVDEDRTVGVRFREFAGPNRGGSIIVPDASIPAKAFTRIKVDGTEMARVDEFTCGPNGTLRLTVRPASPNLFLSKAKLACAPGAIQRYITAKLRGFVAESGSKGPVIRMRDRQGRRAILELRDGRARFVRVVDLHVRRDQDPTVPQWVLDALPEGATFASVESYELRVGVFDALNLSLLEKVTSVEEDEPPNVEALFEHTGSLMLTSAAL
jgi:hypothetical protein